jgi:hypothetical protein
MIVRRNFLTGAATLVCAPVVVRISNLMPVRTLVPIVEARQFGFVQRLWVHSALKKLALLQASGLSQPEIVTSMNLVGPSGVGGNPWTAEAIRSVIRLDQQIAVRTQPGSLATPRAAGDLERPDVMCGREGRARNMDNGPAWTSAVQAGVSTLKIRSQTGHASHANARTTCTKRGTIRR